MPSHRRQLITFVGPHQTKQVKVPPWSNTRPLATLQAKEGVSTSNDYSYASPWYAGFPTRATAMVAAMTLVFLFYTLLVWALPRTTSSQRITFVVGAVLYPYACFMGSLLIRLKTLPGNSLRIYALFIFALASLTPIYVTIRITRAMLGDVIGIAIGVLLSILWIAPMVIRIMRNTLNLVSVRASGPGIRYN